MFSVACGRHGCYVPQALVDLFKGEQQKNADFSFLKGLKMTNVQIDQIVLLIYDIVCGHIVHLFDRIGIHIPPELIIEAAIGLFHVHAHKEQCFFQYAPTFIPGTGIVAGEILESLWSSLNSISPMSRTATLAHRAETLDDHATDSNHKKLIGMVATLCRLYWHAVDMFDHAQLYFHNLTEEAGATAVEMWTEDIVRAEKERRKDVTVMDIYAAKLAAPPAGKTSGTSATGTSASGTSASGTSGTSTAWMELALRVEEKQ